MTVLIARLIRDDSMYELVRRDDGQDVLRVFLHELDCDRELTPESATEWCETVKSCGGTVSRNVTAWPAKGAGA